MKSEYKFEDIFDADLNLMKFGQNHREKIRISSLIELAKMPQAITIQ